MRDNVVSMTDPFYYVMGEDDDEEKIVGVYWRRDNNIVNFGMEGQIHATCKYISPHELRQLMIMWLALKYPDTLSYDTKDAEISAKEHAK